MGNVTDRASKGGRARAAALTKEERSESARKAVSARWAKERTTAPSVSVSIGSRNSLDTKLTEVNVTKQYHEEPQITTEVSTWSVNLHSSVITPKKTESYTQ